MKHLLTSRQFLLESDEIPEKKVTTRPIGGTSERWYLNGKLHQDDLPAWILYRPDGSIEWENWYRDGKLDREDGPAQIEYRPDGSVRLESWYRNGKQHREDGPAQIEYRPDGSVEREKWYLTGFELGEKGIRELKLEAALKQLKSLGFSDEDAEMLAPIF